jgi:endonuclease YncB( thermonuclease family)
MYLDGVNGHPSFGLEMKILTNLILAFFLCSFLAEAQITARVVLVKDGDTYVLRAGKRNMTVRLNHVDAPELSQAWGVQSKIKVANLLTHKIVLFDSTGKDRYGRILGNIEIDGERLDLKLIENGWAWHYVNYSNEQILADAMKNAADQQKGLWYCGKARVCPPWMYRGYNRTYRSKYCRGCK